MLQVVAALCVICGGELDGWYLVSAFSQPCHCSSVCALCAGITVAFVIGRASLKEQMKAALSERDELKRERDVLEAKVMKMDAELRSIQQVEERKYQVEIMGLKAHVKELDREMKKHKHIQPKGAMMEAAAVDQPALTSALERVQARKNGDGDYEIIAGWTKSGVKVEYSRANNCEALQPCDHSEH